MQKAYIQWIYIKICILLYLKIKIYLWKYDSNILTYMSIYLIHLIHTLYVIKKQSIICKTNIIFNVSGEFTAKICHSKSCCISFHLHTLWKSQKQQLVPSLYLQCKQKLHQVRQTYVKNFINNELRLKNMHLDIFQKLKVLE